MEGKLSKMFGVVISLTVLGLIATSPTGEDDVRVLGGQDIDISRAPHIISLVIGGNHSCGGSIIGKNLIISAAHCFGTNPNEYKIRVGSTTSTGGGTLYQVKRIKIHPNYNLRFKDFDIAVLWLSQPIEFGANAQPIALIGAGEEIRDGENMVITGWGMTKPGGQGSKILQMVSAPKWNEDECRRSYANVVSITPRMICIGATGKGACKGDSCGPAVYNNKLAGLVSGGMGDCTETNYPGIFTKVSSLRKWVDETITTLKAEESATSLTSNNDDIRIVGGQSIDISKAPHQISLVFGGKHFCGGSIIDKNVIVTAAHCMTSRNPKDYQVRVGSSSNKKGGTLHAVQKLLINPSYNPNNFESDIAVMWLSQPIQFGANARPITLFNSGEEIRDGENVIVTGWGGTQPGGGGAPEILQMVTVPKWNDNECKKVYGGLVSPRMVCAGATHKGSCQGDSGGPLVYNNKLAGVVSWGAKICTIENHPGVFAKISALRTWLDQAILSLKAEGSATSPTSNDDDIRIVGGQEIDISMAPHQISLVFGGGHMCGGSIIDKNIIVTAAHCLEGVKPKDLQIRVGSSSRLEGGTLQSVQKFLINPSYNKKTADYDIAVLWLSQPIQFGANAKAIALFNTDEEIRDGENVIVTGWGRTQPGGGGAAPTILQMVTVPKWNDNECKKSYGQGLTSRMMCAGATHKGSCQGDSGGPLVYNNKLAGVVSWGHRNCTIENYPGVFAKVSALRTWLDQVIASLKAEGSAEFPTTNDEDFRIVGGQDIDISKAPHQISLLFQGRYDCGGSIIDKNVIVTAAHCLERRNPKDLKIRVGSSSRVEGGTLHSVKKLLINPSFNSKTADSDIAVIWLSQSIQFGTNARPITLFNSSEEIRDGENVIVTGWGGTKPGGGGAPDILQMVMVPKWNDNECKKVYDGIVTQVTPRMICAGATHKGSCHGDSGGPLVYNNKLAGVVSWGDKVCTTENRPGVFAKISALRTWLDQAILSLKAEDSETPKTSDDDDIRIVGGQDIDISKAPHQISLVVGGRHICGGSIIDKNIIVTAAHCVVSSNPKDYQIRVGSSSCKKGGTLLPVQKILPNPSFSPKTLDYDIAVIWLSQPIQFGENAKPIALFNTGEEVKDGENVIITGWGDTRPGGQGTPPEILQMVTVPKWNDNECSKAHAKLLPVTPRMICAGHSKGPCKGDSGGPLVYNNKLAGVVSWGNPRCTYNGSPGVFAKVSALRTWLDQAIASLKVEYSHD